MEFIYIIYSNSLNKYRQQKQIVSIRMVQIQYLVKVMMSKVCSICESF